MKKNQTKNQKRKSRKLLKKMWKNMAQKERNRMLEKKQGIKSFWLEELTKASKIKDKTEKENKIKKAIRLLNIGKHKFQEV